MAVSACIQSFILAILCGSPILRAAFVTILNSLLLRLSADIDQINLLIGRLAIQRNILSLSISSLNALKDKVAADLNLFLDPIRQFQSCVDLQQIAELLEVDAVGKKFKAFQKKLSDLNRITNLINIQDALKRKKEDQITRIQDFIDEITNLCG